ncbi:MAG: MoaD/ThiS family protein [Actinobacteria bacterium]|nr:MoaD/ThiS family protein [Actinomycetota bacterium]
MIRVRLFASLRELAGASELTDVQGRTVGELADALSARFGERFARIADVSSYVVNGERASRALAVADGDEVAILPPVSGGQPTLVRATAARGTRRRGRPS